MKTLNTIVLALAALAVACGGTAPGASTTPEASPQPAATAEVEAAPQADVAPVKKVKVEGVEIQSEYALEIHFPSRKTYAFAGAEGGVNDPEERWTAPDLDFKNEITTLLRRELEAAGMTEVSSNPDVLVVFSVVVDMEAMKLMKIDNNPQTMVENTPMGAVYVAFIDPETKFTIWLAAAAAEVLENPDVETVKQRLDYAITEIVATIPDE